MRVFMENAVGIGLLAREHGVDVNAPDVVSGIIDQIEKIARESYPLHQVMSHSDLVLHAEGPGAEHNLPWLSAFNWLTETANRNMRALIKSTLYLLGTESGRIARDVDLRISGIAPGSLWLGLKLMLPAADFLPEDEHLRERLLETTTRLPMLARFIDDENLQPGIREAEPDPALLDAALLSLLAFSPTGKRGIHTLEISSREHGSASLSQRERVVLQETFRRPDTKQLRESTFDGEVREADLDKTRFHLRTTDGMIRCVMPALHPEQARKMLGLKFRATGPYETNREGRPRLLFVEKIEPLPETGALV
jgi:hypothetical protein